jgi:hypothetical protein
VSIVTAGVHRAWSHGSERKSSLLLDRERVHVRPQQHDRTLAGDSRGPAQQRRHAGTRQTSLDDVEIEPGELPFDERRSGLFPVGELRQAVNRSPQFDDPFLDGRRCCQ